MSNIDQHLDEQPPFRVLPLVAGILVVLLGISLASQWYAQNITLPRFCEDPVQAFQHVREILTKRDPVDEDSRESRRPYLIAGKLLFLVPQNSEETQAEYLQRLQQYLDQQCR